jgi:hypothetical protein
MNTEINTEGMVNNSNQSNSQNSDLIDNHLNGIPKKKQMKYLQKELESHFLYKILDILNGDEIEICDKIKEEFIEISMDVDNKIYTPNLIESEIEKIVDDFDGTESISHFRTKVVIEKLNKKSFIKSFKYQERIDELFEL